MRCSILVVLMVSVSLLTQANIAFAADQQLPRAGEFFDPVYYSGPYTYTQCGGTIPETDFNGQELKLDDRTLVFVLKEFTPDGVNFSLFLAGNRAGSCGNPPILQPLWQCPEGTEVAMVVERGPHTTVKSFACFAKEQNFGQTMITRPLWPTEEQWKYISKN